MGRGWAKAGALWLLDVACVGVSFLIAANLCFDDPTAGSAGNANEATFWVLVVMTVLLDFLAHENQSLMKTSGAQEFGRVLRYSLLLVLGVVVASYAFHLDPTPSRLMLAVLFAVNVVVMWLGRWLAKRIAGRVFGDGETGTPIVMVVERGRIEEVKRRFTPGMTYRIFAWLELEGGLLEGEVNGRGLSCDVQNLGEALRGACMEEVPDFFVYAPHATEREVARVVDAVERYGTSCHVAIHMPDPSLQGARLGYFGEMPVVTYTGRGSLLYRRYVKRVLDVLISLIVIILSVIPAAVLALVIAIQSGGSPFYWQQRLGRGGRHFRIYKFRSMVIDADDVERYFTAAQLEQWHRERKVDGDPRITRVGRFLRRTSLDEFPQFVNVLRGDMSLVGPRPIVDEELRHYGNHMDEFLSIRPGLTGWWQVMARNSATYEDGARQELELYYVRHSSFTLDRNIVKRTFGAVFGATGQ